MAAGLWWWWPMSPWISPGAVWFIVFNVVVGAIAILSRGDPQGGHAPPATRRNLARTASTVVMERLRSISISSFHSAADYGVASSPAPQLDRTQDQYCYYTSQEQEAGEEQLVSREAPGPHKLEPAPVAEKNGSTATTAPPRAPVATTTEAADAAALALESKEEAEADDSISLDEAYALARQRHAQAQQSPPASAAASEAAAATAGRPRKREPAKVVEVKRRAYACGRVAEVVEGKAELNARAELFIRQFREELKLQRLNSIINYTRTLRHGAGTVAGNARGSSGRSI